ncbi:MAG: CDP-alcohol phosphatidyltransferase family protein [Spirochaetia bacterium]|nr:CDP-alcohol phosphatidyltransferase family protein [Spirochaetia bacterium]
MTVKELFQYKVLTISNVLSFIRILLAPVIWFLLKETDNDPTYNYYAAFVGFIMVLTDYFDGFLARKLGQETPLGQYLDPIADKIAIISVGTMLYLKKEYPIWIIILVIIREIIGVFGGGFLLVKREVLGRPNYWGKGGVAMAALSGLMYVLDLPHKEWTIYGIAVLFIGGALAYIKTYWKTVLYGHEK